MKNLLLVLEIVFLVFADACRLPQRPATGAFGQLNQMAGNWANIDRNTRGLTKLNILVSDTKVTLHVWGKCQPTDCDWGSVIAVPYAPNVSSNLANTADVLSAVFKTRFSESIVIIYRAGPDRLRVEDLTRFKDASGRSNYRSVYTFSRFPVVSEDCLPYNPANLRIMNEGERGWLLTDGVSRMLILDNEMDAQNALALARRHTSHCFIGRGNNRPNRLDYIVEYWEGNTEATTTISPEDCIPYNPANLQIVPKANGWFLMDGPMSMLMLDNKADAEAALNLAKAHSRQCFIGRGNTRPNRKSYIVQYWE